MELTVNNALLKGIEAHKAGRIQEADQMYTAILKVQPNHPDANHNMGVLAVGLGKVEESLPFFKKAIESNQSVVQFWLSYLDALIKLDKFVDARRIIKKAEDQGIKGNVFDNLKKRLNPISPDLDVQSSKKLLDAAINLRESGKFDQAIDLVKKKIDLAPKNPELYAFLSHCYILKDDIKKADIYLNYAKEINPNVALVGWNEVRILLKKKNVIDALNVAKKFIKLFPKDVEGMGVLGSCLLANKNIDESEVFLNKAIELDQSYAEAYLNRGLIKISKQEISSALDDLEKAYEIKPYIYQVWPILASIYLGNKNFDKAEKLYKRLVEKEPLNEKYFFSLGICQQRQGALESAIDSYKKAIKIKPDYSEAYTNIGVIHSNSGEQEKAIEIYEKAIKIKKDYIALNNLGLIYSNINEQDKAIVNFQKALNIKPDFAEAYINIGNSLVANGNPKLALENFNKAIEIKPNSPELYNNVANVYSIIGDLRESIKSYTKAIEINPNYTNAYNNLAKIFMKTGEKKSAIKNFELVIKNKPNHPEALHLLNSLKGKTTESAPNEYVKNLFNDHADDFEETLLNKLGYNIPRKISEIITKNKSIQLGSVLDMGCGTGLVGKELNGNFKYIEGIDLSEKMLNTARMKNIYNKLGCFDISQYLSHQPLNFDYFIAADVFVYLGNLSMVFELIKSNNKKDGILVFSVEKSEREDFYLTEAGRYAHSKEYIMQLSNKFGYEVIDLINSDLRKENNIIIQGYLCILRFSAI